MKKVKKFLEKTLNKNNSYTAHEIINAIKETKAKPVIIEMNNGRKFMVEYDNELADLRFSLQPFVTLKNVFVDGTHYKETIDINVSCISNIQYEQ